MIILTRKFSNPMEHFCALRAESFGVKQLIFNTVLHTYILKIVCIFVKNSVHN